MVVGVGCVGGDFSQTPHGMCFKRYVFV